MNWGSEQKQRGLLVLEPPALFLFTAPSGNFIPSRSSG